MEGQELTFSEHATDWILNDEMRTAHAYTLPLRCCIAHHVDIEGSESICTGFWRSRTKHDGKYLLLTRGTADIMGS